MKSDDIGRENHIHMCVLFSLFSLATRPCGWSVIALFSPSPAPNSSQLLVRYHQQRSVQNEARFGSSPSLSPSPIITTRLPRISTGECKSATLLLLSNKHEVKCTIHLLAMKGTFITWNGLTTTFLDKNEQTNTEQEKFNHYTSPSSSSTEPHHDTRAPSPPPPSKVPLFLYKTPRRVLAAADPSSHTTKSRTLLLHKNNAVRMPLLDRLFRGSGEAFPHHSGAAPPPPPSPLFHGQV